MAKLSTIEALTSYTNKLQSESDPNKPCVTICGGTGCRANHGLEVSSMFNKLLKEKGLSDDVDVRTTGCHGFCAQGPLVVLVPKGVLYVSVKPEDVEEIITASVQSDEIIERLTYRVPGTKDRIAIESEIPFYANQQRLVFAGSRKMDPTRIEDYIATGGYSSLRKVLSGVEPEEIIDSIEKSGLRGRGGGGFQTGRKWRSCRKSQATTKYVICNGDEGDPGAFIDRSIMEGNPHSVLEGMMIGAYAIGSNHGYIYVRLEYPLAIENLQIAIEQAREHGLLGDNILGTDFSFDIQISRGAGAFVCGESTALMASIEGFVGEPRAKHIHTTEKGLFGQPTNLNNVETWANIPLIIEKGWQWYSSIGSENSKGTKVFSVVGKVRNTGLVEVPMGITLREIIYDICGGVPDNRQFKSVQTGGPSGGCLPEEKLDLQVDFDCLTEAGSMMGSGGMIIMDDRSCMVEVARYFTEFLTRESCGKCTACREGVMRMLEILDRITQGKADMSDIDLLEELCLYVQDNSICGLGKSAPNPTLSSLKYFKDEYIEHIKQKRCRAGVCRDLTTFVISEDKCKACGKCIKSCPVEAITGQKKVTHIIDNAVCTSCGVCREVCPFDAVDTQ